MPSNTLSHYEKNLVLHYDFQGVSSTIVPDVTGTGSAGVIRGYDRGGAAIANEIVFGRTLPVLSLTGGEKGGYLQMPDGILNNEDGLTVSFYCQLRSLDSYGTLFSFGEDSCLYLSVIPNPEDAESFLVSPGVTNGGRSQEAALLEWVPVKKGLWFHVIVTLNTAVPSEGRFYIDGRLAGVFNHRRMGALHLQDCKECYFGYGALSKNPLNLSVSDIRVYHSVVAENDVPALFYISNEARVALEIAALADLFPHVMAESLTLPTAGKMSTTIVWESLSPAVISAEGKITRPAANQPDASAAIKATVSYDGFTDTKEFTFTVPALPTDEKIVEMDLDAIELPYPTHISADIPLPKSGAFGTSFVWSSSNPAVLSQDGMVTRPISPQELVLTVTGTYGKASAERSFTLRVLPVYGQTAPAHTLTHVPDTSEAPVPAADLIAMHEIDFTDEGILHANQKRCLDYLLLLDADRMLYNFRKAFGEDTGTVLPLGGWEEPAGLLRGHSTGHFLSALAFAFVSTHDEAYRQKAAYMVGELRKLQLMADGSAAAFTTKCSPSNAAQSLWSRDPKVWGKGFLSAYSPDQFALLELYTPYATIWAPYYTLHKLLAGFLDCYLQMQMESALDCAKGIGDWVYDRLSATTEEQRNKMWSMYIAGEYGGMNESLARLACVTGDDRYLETAKMFDNPNVFTGLAEGKDTITGIHANQHIPQIIGAMEEYNATQDSSYYRIARNFWELVVNHYMYSIGGVGRGENFKEPDILAGNIESDRNCETCAAYNMLKLTAMLYRYTPDFGDYMDYYERTMINQIAASQNPVVKADSHNGVTYMLPIGPGAHREYSNDYEDFTCCHGTGMENHVRYSENIYHLGADTNTLYVNLFLSSSYHWAEKGITLIQETSFPSETSTLTIKGNASLQLHLRIPAWCRDSFTVTLNGETLPATCRQGSYFVVEKDFVNGDCLVLHMPYSLHLCFTQDKLEDMPVASLMYGPIVMVAENASQDWLTLSLPPVLSDSFVQAENTDFPVFFYDNLRFIPMYEAHNRPYHTYFKANLL